MGIKIFIEAGKVNLEAPYIFNALEYWNGISKFGLILSKNLSTIFHPIEVVEWRYLVGERIGGENVRTYKLEDFETKLEKGEINPGLYSIYRINGRWEIGGQGQAGFISINISPLIKEEGHIYMDVIPGLFDDINDMIYSSEDHETIVKNIIDILKVTNLIEGSSRFTVKRLISEDDEHSRFIYSKDTKMAWRIAQDSLADMNHLEDKRAFYNWEKIYDLLIRNPYANSEIRKFNNELGVLEEAGSIVLIGKSEDSLDRLFVEMSKKLKSLMDKLEPRSSFEEKIDEVFGQTKLPIN